MNKDFLKKSIVIMPASDKKAIALIYATLKEYGFDPVATHEWEDARKIFIGSSPDLIVINLDKPDDEAIEKLELLRNCVKTKDVPVIIVSSSDRNDFNMGYPLNGKEVFMTKPIPADDFLSTVKKAIFK